MFHLLKTHGNVRFMGHSGSVADPDPYLSEKWDPDPQRNGRSRNNRKWLSSKLPGSAKIGTKL
jgi:hypothetical protein